MEFCVTYEELTLWCMCVRINSSATFIIVVVYIFVEQIDTQGLPRTESVAKFTAEDFSFSPSGFIKSFRHILKVGSDIFLIRFLLGASVILLRSNYSLYLEKKFDASAQMTGWLISYGAVVNTFGGFLAGNVAKYYNDSVKMSYHSSLLLVLTLFLMMLSPGIPSFLICVTLTLCVHLAHQSLRHGSFNPESRQGRDGGASGSRPIDDGLCEGGWASAVRACTGVCHLRSKSDQYMPGGERFLPHHRQADQCERKRRQK
ncbi:putative major facilitator superfamily domain-containing protein 9 isoform X1 [Apostichopus japonicus]|uniref:Putative major facilitator superfamily domain-containing protein 9 isoform X1 n=1 Tax=Stichopus japonicus TaxID=307972 RepID=A0A2G8KG34_STIJA|nr:putative major facilitator superfamily domain-containing protein 9 isoform X1 [Apostichopus japonicus]